MKFTFSIRQAIKESWQIFKLNPWYFIALSGVMLVLNVVSQKEDGIIVTILVSIAAIVWSYVWLSSTLQAVDGKVANLKLSSISEHFPTFRMFWKMVLLGITASVITLVGFILLIVPGIYFMTKLSLSNLALVDRKGGVRQSMKYSWHMITGPVFWKVLLVLIAALGLVVLGVLALLVGFLVAYPLAMLVVTKLYRALSKHHATQEIVVQPEEIPPHVEEVKAEEVKEETVQ